MRQKDERKLIQTDLAWLLQQPESVERDHIEEILRANRTQAKSDRLRVYIAGPYTSGDIGANVRAAIDAGNSLAAVGYHVFIPHLDHFWHLIHPHEWEFWIAHDLGWLSLCHYFVRLPGESRGADLEESRARELGITVTMVDELLKRSVE